jgi:hypothetical protein
MKKKLDCRKRKLYISESLARVGEWKEERNARPLAARLPP